MSTINRVIAANKQKISRGQFLLGPVGGTYLRNIGNAIVERTLAIETVDIETAEDPRLARLAKVTTKANEDLKVTCKSMTALVNSLAFMAPQGEYTTQVAIANGQFTIPAGAKDGDIYDFVDADGHQVFNVVVTPADALTHNVVVDGPGGSLEIIGDRTASEQLPFTAPVISAAQKQGVFRKLQAGEIRMRARFRENNAFGVNSVHDWPIISIRATGSQKLSDVSNDVQSIELDCSVEYDNNAVGRERGTVRELA